MSEAGNTALLRKLSAGREDLKNRPRSVLRALRLGFARAAADRLNLPLAVIGAKQSLQSVNDLVDAVGDDWLLLFLTGPDGVAAACLDPNAVSAILQTQTIGQVTETAPEARAFTNTDAAMTAPLLEAALAKAAELAENASDEVGLIGYEYMSRAQDLRSVCLTLVEDMYCGFELTVDLAGGIRQGHIFVLLPRQSSQVEDCLIPEADEGPSLEQSSGVVRAELNAVLCRMSVPLSDLSGLSAGDILPLQHARLDRTEILAIDRSRTAVGRLGQCGGLRAVRVNEQAPLAALSDVETQEFIESRAASASQNAPDMPLGAQAVDVTDYRAGPDTLEAQEGDLSFENSEQMVAEISQLAGLSGPDDVS